MRAIMLAVAILIGANVQASAQYKLMFGQGVGTSCGSWTQARQTRTATAGLSAQWIAGYLSGLNNEPTSADFLRGTDFDGIMAWIDNFCQANPLEKIGTAAYHLGDELRSRAQR